MSVAGSDADADPRVSALILCAGRSTRCAPLNKLLVRLDGVALACRAVDAALATPLHEVVVVSGHQADQLRAALAERPLRWAHNPDFASGIASSIRVGVQALAPSSDGVLICLGDMPEIRSEHLRALVDAFGSSAARPVCVPTFGGKRGNPVLWPRAAYTPLQSLRGDTGGRLLLPRYAQQVRWVAMPDAAVLDDLDTPEAIGAYAGAPPGPNSGRRR